MKFMNFLVKTVIVIGLALITAIVLLACFGETKYKVTFDADNGTENTIEKVGVDEAVAKPATDPTKDGNTFLYWSYDETTEYNFETIVTSNMTLLALYDTHEYTITFEVNGGDALDSNTLTFEFGSTVTLPTPTKTDYTFDGWFNGETEYKTGEWNTVLANKEITLSAKWSDVVVAPVTNTITFEVDGGTHTNGTTYTDGDTTALTAATKEGYTFDGWFTEDTFTTQVTSLTGLTGNITLYAKFTVNAPVVTTNTITFEVDGGTHTNGTTYTDGDTTALTAATKEGFTFDGWYTTSDFNGDVVTSLTDLTGDIALYAKFTVNAPVTNTITFDVDGGTHTNGTTYTDGDTTALTDATKEGYTFDGWFTTSDFSGDAVTSLTDLTGDITLYAKWVEDTSGEVIE